MKCPLELAINSVKVRVTDSEDEGNKFRLSPTPLRARGPLAGGNARLRNSIPQATAMFHSTPPCPPLRRRCLALASGRTGRTPRETSSHSSVARQSAPTGAGRRHRCASCAARGAPSILWNVRVFILNFPVRRTLKLRLGHNYFPCKSVLVGKEPAWWCDSGGEFSSLPARSRILQGMASLGHRKCRN